MKISLDFERVAREVKLINETHAIMLMQAGMQANQFASLIDYCTGNITKFTKNHGGKFLFSQDSKETCSLIFVSVIKRGMSGKHHICQNNTYLCFS